MTTELKVMDRSLTELFLRRRGMFGRQVIDVEVYDPHGHDREWHAFIGLPHKVAEWEGYRIPAFEGDVERIEWERARRSNQNLSGTRGSRGRNQIR